MLTGVSFWELRSSTTDWQTKTVHHKLHLADCRLLSDQEVLSAVNHDEVVARKPIETCVCKNSTRSSAVAERPRDASCHSIFRSVSQGPSTSLEMVLLESLGTVSYLHSTVTMTVSCIRLSCIISEIKRDIGRRWRFFHTTPAFDAPARCSLSEYCHSVNFV